MRYINVHYSLIPNTNFTFYLSTEWTAVGCLEWGEGGNPQVDIHPETITAES
jgi:hypothetical protein